MGWVTWRNIMAFIATLAILLAGRLYLRNAA
jgi:hypothetical protein